MVAELYALPGRGGIFPPEPSGLPLDLFRWLTPTPGVVWALFWGQLLAAVLLMVGLGTRPAALACFVLQVTLNQRMSQFAFGGDNVLRVFLFLMVLAPAGAAWTPRDAVPPGCRAGRRRRYASGVPVVRPVPAAASAPGRVPPQVPAGDVGAVLSHSDNSITVSAVLATLSTQAPRMGWARRNPAYCPDWRPRPTSPPGSRDSAIGAGQRRA